MFGVFQTYHRVHCAKKKILFRGQLSIRLALQPLRTIDPVVNIDHQGHLFKTINRGYQYKRLQPLAFELWIQFFVPTIRQEILFRIGWIC